MVYGYRAKWLSVTLFVFRSFETIFNESIQKTLPFIIGEYQILDNGMETKLILTAFKLPTHIPLNFYNFHHVNHIMQIFISHLWQTLYLNKRKFFQVFSGEFPTIVFTSISGHTKTNFYTSLWFPEETVIQLSEVVQDTT